MGDSQGIIRLLKHFVADILVCEIDDPLVSRYVTGDLEQKGVDVVKLLDERRAKSVLALDYTTRHLFKLSAPKDLIAQVFKQTTNDFIQSSTTEALCLFLVKQLYEVLFVKHIVGSGHPVFGDPRPIIQQVMDYFEQLDVNKSKRDFQKWLCVRGNKPNMQDASPQLLQTYVSYIFPKSNELRNTNPLTNNVLDWIRDESSIDLLESKKRTEYDAILWSVFQDHDFFRHILGRTLVVLHPQALHETQYPYLAAILTSTSKTFAAPDAKKLVILSNDTIHKYLEQNTNINYTALNLLDENNLQETLKYIPHQCLFKVVNVLPESLVANYQVPTTFAIDPQACYVWVGGNEINTSYNNKQTCILAPNALVCKSCIKNGTPFVPIPSIPNPSTQTMFTSIAQDMLDIALANYTQNTPQKKARELVYKHMGHAFLEKAASLPPTSNKAHHTQCIIVIDNRPNGLSLMSLYISLANLNASQWDVVVFTSTKTKAYYERALCNIFDAYVLTHPILNKEPFDIEIYNELLKDADLWKMLLDMGYKTCLTVQDDAAIMRPGLDDDKELMTADYLGAPWLPCNENKELATFPGAPHMVGNGGLSIRNVEMCYDICNTSKNKNALFHHRLQRIQEDVFFTREVQLRNGRVPDATKASTFSTEQVFNPKSYGFHKIWPYHPIEKIEQFFTT